MKLSSFFLVFGALLFLNSPSHSQGVIQQFGNLIAGDAIMSQGNNRAVDAGNATVPQIPGTRLTSLGIVNSGFGLCQWNPDPGNNTVFSTLCSGFSGANGQIYFNSPTSASLNFDINGTVYSLPGIFNNTVPAGFVSVTAAPYNACIEASPGYVATPVDPAGTCDATAAINAAIASGNNVYFPPGLYHIKNQIVCNGYGQKLVGAGRLQSIFDIGSDMSMGASSVLNLGAASTQVQGSCELSDLGIQFYQNPSDTTRAQLIAYPIAINSAASRVLINNLRISRGYNCINLTGNYTVTLTGDIELGCFNQNLYMDGQLDFSFIHSIEVWPFGSSNISNLVGIWNDHSTQAAFIGRSDGLEINNFSSESGSIFISNDEVTSTGIDFGVLHMDAFATLTHTSGSLRIGLFSGADDGGANAVPTIVEDVGSGILGQMTIGTIQYETSNSANCPVQVHGGKLIISGGYWLNNVDNTAFCEDTNVSPSYLMLTGLFISPPTTGGTLANPVIKQTLGALVFNDNVFNVAASGRQGTMLSVASDNGQTHISNNNYGGWTGAVSLGFLPLSTGGLGLGGYYDLAGVEFPFTATPNFTTTGDFAPTAITCTGCLFELNGDFATIDMNLQWTNNNYTTATGTFIVSTNLPRSVSPTGIGTPFAVENLSGMALLTSPQQQFPLSVNLNGASNFSFSLANSGATSGLAGAPNFPASRSYQVVIGGRYPIRIEH